MSQQASSSQHPTNKIQVSNSKQPVNFYVNLCKRMLKSGEKEVELSGLGNAIFTVVTVVEILKNQGVVDTKNINTSSVAVGNQQPAQNGGAKKLKPKIQVFVTKSKNFETIIAQQEKEQEARRLQKQAAPQPAAAAQQPASTTTTSTKQQ